MRHLITGIVLLMSVASAFAAEEDTLQFFKEEANVVSTSLQPQPENQSPSTVYVVTQREIKESGSQNLWDALRSVPGLDVVSARTGDGEVSVRGYDYRLSPRLLVLMDGREVNYGVFDNVAWSSIPVSVDDIDRIEVVEGPASAVYGSGAMLGVVNIITKRPEQLDGGVVRYSIGERHTQNTDFTFGKQIGKLGYKVSSGWQQANSFEEASHEADEASHVTSDVNYDFSEHSALHVAAGLSTYDPELTDGSTIPFNLKGHTSFVKTDYHWESTSFHSYWNRLETHPTEGALSDQDVNANQYDATLEQAFKLPWNHDSVLAANYRRNTVDSIAFGGHQAQDLWAFFGEDKWKLADHWLLLTSGRVDRHPLTPIQFSPRASVLYTPVTDQVFRVSAGRAYRAPTLDENYLNFSSTSRTYIPGHFTPFPLSVVPNINSVLTESITGATTLEPEAVDQIETAYNGRFNHLKVNAELFHYNVSNAINFGNIYVSTSATVTAGLPPTINATTLANAPYGNLTNKYKASGGEVGSEYYINEWLSTFGNYSYQYLWADGLYPVNSSPRHKANVGLHTSFHGFTSQWTTHWVDATHWAENTGTAAYFVVDANVTYHFSGRLKGFEVGANAFNLLNHDHYEVPALYGGEIIKSSFSGTASYQF